MDKEISELDDGISVKEKLPEMLNVITIMTLGYSSMIFISSTINLFIGKQFIEEIQTTLADNSQEIEKIENPFLLQLFNTGMDALDNFPILNLITLSVAVISITAAFLMRKLKKNGFFIYVLATFIEIGGPIYILGAGISAGIVIAGSVFSILFIILYGVNLKHLK